VNDSERRRENKRERARAEGARGTGIATERPLRNEQPVGRASASCWLLAAGCWLLDAAVAAVAEYGAANEAKTQCIDEARRARRTARDRKRIRVCEIDNEKGRERERGESRIDRVARGWSNRRPTGWSAFHASRSRGKGSVGGKRRRRKGRTNERASERASERACGPSSREKDLPHRRPHIRTYVCTFVRTRHVQKVTRGMLSGRRRRRLTSRKGRTRAP